MLRGRLSFLFRSFPRVEDVGLVSVISYLLSYVHNDRSDYFSYRWAAERRANATGDLFVYQCAAANDRRVLGSFEDRAAMQGAIEFAFFVVLEFVFSTVSVCMVTIAPSLVFGEFPLSPVFCHGGVVTLCPAAIPGSGR